MGPLASKGHFEKVKSYLKLIESEGGNVILGGNSGSKALTLSGLNNSKFGNGYFVEPTIVTNLSIESRCALEEMFGPVLTIHTFTTEEEAIEMANIVKYGLAASVWTSDIRRGQRIARQLEAGTVWINCYTHGDSRMPFGGYKESGVQREGGVHSIDFFTEIKSIVSKL